MKKLLIVFILLLCFTGVTFAGEPIKSITTHQTETILAGGNSTSSTIKLRGVNPYGPDGFFSLQLALSGSGIAKIEYLLSNNGTDFIEPAAATDILSNFTSTSGPSNDGKTIVSFSPAICQYMQIKVTETGGSDSIIVSIVVAYQ